MTVIEGTWEEIERRKEELVGCYLRVIVTAEKASPQKAAAPAAHPPSNVKKLRGYGMFACMLTV